MSVASEVLRELQQRGLVSARISVDGDVLAIQGSGALRIPGKDGPTSWRRTVNSSLLPRSISAESRRHLLYAILQDLVHSDLLLRRDGTTASILTPLGAEFQAFEDVYRVPAQGRSDRTVIYPVHIAIPVLFDTYRRAPAHRQTDKGFRGPFIEFFSCDHTGQSRDDGLLLILQDLFARTSGLSALDLALVKSVSQQIEADRPDALLELTGSSTLPVTRGDDAEDAAAEIWLKVYDQLPAEPTFRPLRPFAEQGVRIRMDIQAIACAAGLSRIQRIAMVERLLSYHLAAYLVRLSKVLYKELDSAVRLLRNAGDEGPTEWTNADIAIRYHAKGSAVQTSWGADYQRTMIQLNEAYLMLPVLNNVELALRAIRALPGTQPIRNDRLAWADAAEGIDKLGSDRLGLLREAVTVLAAIGGSYVGVAISDMSRLESSPVEALFDSVRLHYTDPGQRRYPGNHHQLVFEGIADHGTASFVQRRPRKHFALGDEFIFLLVLALFEHRDPEDRVTSTATRHRGELRRWRLPLRQLEEKLEVELLMPADDAASRDLRTSLARLGLLDRLSDVGAANFLRHPTGI